MRPDTFRITLPGCSWVWAVTAKSFLADYGTDLPHKRRNRAGEQGYLVGKSKTTRLRKLLVINPCEAMFGQGCGGGGPAVASIAT